MKLLPCPFCGAPADPSSSGYLIWCANTNCRVHVEVFADSPAEAVETWNTRAPAPSEAGVPGEYVCNDDDGAPRHRSVSDDLQKTAIPRAYIVHDDPELGDYLTWSKTAAEQSGFGYTALFSGPRMQASLPVYGDLRETIARIIAEHFYEPSTFSIEESKLFSCRDWRDAVKVADDILALPQLKAQAEAEARLRAKLAYLVDESTYEDSYGVQGSDFLCCRFCEAGGAPNVSFVHNEKCPVLRCEDVVTEWWNDLKADRELIKAQAEALDVALEALKSMAGYAGDIPAHWADSHQCVTECGHFRRAATAIAMIKELRG